MKTMKFHVIFVTVLLALFAFNSRVYGRKIMRASKEIPNDAPEIQSLASFAVQGHNDNNKENGLEFVKVLKAKEEVAGAKIYYLTLVAVDAGKMKIYEAKIRVHLWMNVIFKQVQEFKLVDHVICEGDRMNWPLLM